MMGEQIIHQEHQYEIIKRDGVGFGIAISGGRDNPAVLSGNPAIVISDVIPHGPAFGKLQTGDTVRKINNISTHGMTQHQAITELKYSGRRLVIAVKRKTVVFVDRRRTPSPVESRRSRGRPYGRSRSVASRYSRYRTPSSSSRSPSPPRRSPPRRGRSQSRYGGYSRSLSRPRSRRRSYSSRSASSSGRSVSPIRSMTKRMSIEDPSLPALSPDPPGSKGGPDVMVFPVKASRNRNVVLKKTGWNNSYGLKLGTRIFIQDIHPGSLADQNPHLKKGDTILEINGRKLDNKTMQEALQYIGLSKDKLSMVVHGEHGGTVSIPVSQFSKPAASKSCGDLRERDEDSESSYSRRKRK